MEFVVALPAFEEEADVFEDAADEVFAEDDAEDVFADDAAEEVDAFEDAADDVADDAADETADEARSSCDQYSHRFVLFLGAKLNYFGAKVHKTFHFRGKVDRKVSN